MPLREDMSSSTNKVERCWHPVAYGDSLSSDKPLGVTLLDEPIVLWRTKNESDGIDEGPVAMKDVCIHRGTALSLGSLDAENLVCAYHGWRYDRTGACVHIPQTEKPTVPRKARVPAYHCQERYGLIWVALGEPAYELPDVPELEDGNWKIVNTGPFTWKADASRQVENFTDFGHFPWVHPGLLGDIERPVVADYTVDTRGTSCTTR